MPTGPRKEQRFRRGILGCMCGRYGRFSRKERIEQALGFAVGGGNDLGTRYNICPGRPDWVIR